MNNSKPEPTPPINDLDLAIKSYGKPMEPKQKERLMEKLKQEKGLFMRRHRGRSRQIRRGRLR